MKLTNYITITGPYKGSSKRPFFKSLSIGDTVEVSIEVEPITRARTGLFATMVTMKNCNRPNTEPFEDSMTMTAKALDKMQFVEQQ